MVRAYVTGDVDIEGDFKEGLRACRELAERIRATGPPDLANWPTLLGLLVRLGGIGPLPRVPVEELRVGARANSRSRAKAVVEHHYDLGNDFYELILDESMSYSSGFWSEETGDDLAAAQRAKLDLVCDQLGLRPGMRLLDVGCGWGALVRHAAAHRGVHATGVTLSARQAEFAQAKAAAMGLSSLVEIRCADYRDISGGDFDAVACIEMGEHVGERGYPDFCARLAGALRPGGLLLLQQMARGDRSPGGGAFIESYIAQGMTMRSLPKTLAHLEKAGFEVRQVQSLREHYARTIDAWAHRLDACWDEVLHRYGGRRGRIWRLYLAGAALAFETNRMSVHQVLAGRAA